MESYAYFKGIHCIVGFFNRVLRNHSQRSFSRYSHHFCSLTALSCACGTHMSLNQMAKFTLFLSISILVFWHRVRFVIVWLPKFQPSISEFSLLIRAPPVRTFFLNAPHRLPNRSYILYTNRECFSSGFLTDFTSLL